MRVTWPVLVATLAMALVGLAGGVGLVDEGVQRALVGDRLHPERDSGVLIAIDEETVERLGPPPWEADTWSTVAAALAGAGLDEVHLVDPASTLVRGEAPADAAPTLHAPTVVRHVRGRAVPFVPEAWGPLAVEGVVLDLPRSRGVVVGLGAAAAGPRSAWCAWTPCPSGVELASPLAAADVARIHVVSLADLLEGRELTIARGPVLLGVTAPGWAHHVPVGPQGLEVTWPEAVALGVGAASGPAVVAPGPLLLAPLLALIVLLGALAARAERVLPAEAWILAVPVVAGGAGALLVGSGLAVLPVLSLSLAGLVGPLLVALGARHRALRFVRRAALDVARGDLGFAWEESLDGSPQGLLRVLGSLTRNHLPSDRMAWLRPIAGDRVEVVGGWGLSASDLNVERLTVRQVRALAKRSRVPGLLRDGSDRAILVPLHGQRGEIHGWWCVAWGAGEPAPALDLLVDLAAWVEGRLPGDSGGAVRSWLRLDGELRAIGTAFARSAEARAAQARVLAEAELPLATADRAGAIIFRNAAFGRRLEALGLPGEPASLRELAWRLGGEDELDQRMRRLFVDHEVVVFGVGEDAVSVAAAGDGFVAWASPTAPKLDERAPETPSPPDLVVRPATFVNLTSGTPASAPRR